MITKRDVVKIIPFTLVGCLLLIDNPNIPVILYSIGLVMLFATLSHVVRKITFFGLSLDAAYHKAMEEPVAAAIVFAAITYFLSTAFSAMVGFLR